MKYFEVTIPFERRNFDTTKSAKYKGELTLFTNEFGIVYNWKIKFTELYIDRYITKSHLDGKKMSYPSRAILFDKLGMTQEVRPTIKSNDIVKLTSDQITIVNDFFNNRDLYDKTIKQIVGVLKGNNPGGEFSKPGQAEMVSSDPLVRNFTILVDDITVLSDTDPDAYIATDISVQEFFGIHKTIQKAFKYMQKDKLNTEFANYIASIKTYVKQYAVDVNEVEREVKKARNEYYKLTSLVKEKAFDDFEASLQAQRAHIYDVWRIKDKAISLKRTNKDWKYLIAEIKDPNNYLPLPEDIHRAFDREKITYRNDGTLYATNEDGHEFINNCIKGQNRKFMKINSEFLNEKRKKYLEKRNEEIFY